MKFVQCNGHILNVANIIEIAVYNYTNSRGKITDYGLYAIMKETTQCRFSLIEHSDKATVDAAMADLLNQLNA